MLCKKSAINIRCLSACSRAANGAGGRLADTDVLTLEEAAAFASKHAGEEITARDFLRAAGRGEITLRAIVHRAAKVRKHDGGVYCNKGEPNENIVPKGCIANLPLTACRLPAFSERWSRKLAHV